MDHNANSLTLKAIIPKHLVGKKYFEIIKMFEISNTKKIIILMFEMFGYLLTSCLFL